jgi:3-oxoacyl-[acyl-carrier protein] reductase
VALEMDDRPPRVVITGGAGSLARALDANLSAAGWRVESPERRLLDVTDEASISSYFHGRPCDLLICNAGVIRDGLLARMTPQDWQDCWEVNFRGAVRCAQAVLPAMREAGGGQIVVISSQSAHDPPPGQAAYACAKAALTGWATGFASEVGASNIRVNAVLPGFLETRMTAGVSEPRRRQVLAEHRLGRFNTAAVVADFIRFLHSQLPHTSGQVFQLDSRCGPV